MYSTTTTTTNTTTTTTTTSTTPTNTTLLSPVQRTPSLSPYSAHPKSDNNAHIKEAINGLIGSIADLANQNEPNFPTLLKICEQLKQNAASLEKAQREPSLNSELNLLREKLPKLFRQIDRCMEIQIRTNTSLDLAPLETCCMGLSTLAPPLTGSLLTEEQRKRSQAILTNISSKLAKLLAGHFSHSIVDIGALLNSANWFSRALKADLIKKDQPAIHSLFEDALHQMHTWSGTNTKPSNLDSRQFCKCMVQLNSMIKQRLIQIEPGKVIGPTNRATWAATVQNLCRHFLTEGAWIHDSQLVELINITNTLKDGLELGLLSSSDTAWPPLFNILAQRIIAQEFDLSNASSLTGLGNCANFLRTLFEHNLLGTADSATGKAVRHLVHALSSKKITSGLNAGSAQALINLASFIKATDRWLLTQPKLAKVGSHAPLAQASATLMVALSVLLADNQNPSWMRSPKTGSALLAALQHLWQRGLVRPEQRYMLEPILRQLLQSIPNWRQDERNSQSTLLSLRALVAMTNHDFPVADLQNSSAFAEALTTLLIQQQQSKQANYTAEERLNSLQAVRIGVARGAVSIAALQPLLQNLLSTKDEVDLLQIETAIKGAAQWETCIEALGAEALTTPTGVSSATSLSANQVNQVKLRGDTYRGPAPQPTKQERIVDTRPAYGSYDWKTVDKGIKSPLIFEEQSLPMPFTATPSGSPRLVERSPQQKPIEQSAGNKQKEKTTEIKKTALMTSLQSTQVVKAQPAQSKSTQIKPMHEVRTLKEAQARWFNLLQELKSTSLEELKKLAEAYPQLLNMKTPGKQGQVALFYALTQGKREIVEWLMKQAQHTLPESLGKFLIAALNAIGKVERSHVAGLRTFIDAYLKQKLGDQTLSKQEIIARKNALLTAEEKVELSLFPALDSLFEETKLITKEDRGAAVKPKLGKNSNTNAKEKITPLLNTLAREMHALPQSEYSKALNFALNKTKAIHVSESNDVAFDVIRSAWIALITRQKKDSAKWVIAFLDKVKDKDALVRIQSENGGTALHLAAASGHLGIVQAILNADIDKNALVQIPSIGGWTALNIAAERGHLDIVQAILNADIDKNALVQIPDKDGWTALNTAAHRGHLDIVQVILNSDIDKNALVQIPNIVGLTALHTAAERGHLDIVQVILNADIDKNALVQIPNIVGLTALHIAATSGHLEIVQAILNADIDKNALLQTPDKDGWPALNIAADIGHLEIVQAILNAGIDKNALVQIPNIDGWTALHVAADSGHLGIVQTILNADIDKKTLVQVPNKDGVTALNVAAERGHNEIVQAILNVKID